MKYIKLTCIETGFYTKIKVWHDTELDDLLRNHANLLLHREPKHQLGHHYVYINSECLRSEILALPGPIEHTGEYRTFVIEILKEGDE